MGNRGLSRSSCLAFVWLGLVALSAAVVTWLPLLYSPATVDLYGIDQPPLTASHWLGTDTYGRDVLAMLLFGARTVFLISFPVALAGTMLGVALGGIAGFWGNYRAKFSPLQYGIVGTLLSFLLGYFFYWAVGIVGLLCTGILWAIFKQRQRQLPLPLDSLVLGLIAVVTSIPRLILVLTLAAVQSPSVGRLFLILLLTYWVLPAQLVRTELLRIRELPYVEAAYAAGLPPFWVLLRHALPNAWQSVITMMPLSVASLIGLETTLSFLGVGLPPSVASWGRLLAAAQQSPTDWWLIVIPGLVLLFTTLSLRQISKQIAAWQRTPNVTR